jgi:hypothetical protein
MAQTEQRREERPGVANRGTVGPAGVSERPEADGAPDLVAAAGLHGRGEEDGPSADAPEAAPAAGAMPQPRLDVDAVAARLDALLSAYRRGLRFVEQLKPIGRHPTPTGDLPWWGPRRKRLVVRPLLAPLCSGCSSRRTSGGNSFTLSTCCASKPSRTLPENRTKTACAG